MTFHYLHASLINMTVTFINISDGNSHFQPIRTPFKVTQGLVKPKDMI